MAQKISLEDFDNAEPLNTEGGTDEKKKSEPQPLPIKSSGSTPSIPKPSSEKSPDELPKNVKQLFAPSEVDTVVPFKQEVKVEEVKPKQGGMFTGELPQMKKEEVTPTQLQQQKSTKAIGSIVVNSEKTNEYKKYHEETIKALEKQNEEITKLENQLAQSTNPQEQAALTETINRMNADYNTTNQARKDLESQIDKTQKQITKDSLNLRYEKDNPLEVAYNAVKSGSESLGANILRSPKFAYDVIAEGLNAVIKPMGGVPLMTGDEIAKKLELGDNEWAKYYEKQAQQDLDKIEKDYDKSSIEYIQNGDYASALTKLTADVMQSVPVTLGIMAAGAAGVGEMAITAAGSAIFGAGEMKQLEDNKDTKNLPHSTKVVNALTKGALEGITENFGVTKLGGIVKDILKKEGKDAAIDFADKGFRELMTPIAKKYFGNTSDEVVSELANTFLGNVTDVITGVAPNKKLTDGLAETALTALGTSLLFSSAPMAMETKQAIADKYKSKEFAAKQALKNDTQTIDQELDANVHNGIMTPQDAVVVKKNIENAIVAKESLPENITNEDNKLKSVELIAEKEELSNKDKALSKPRIEEINGQLDIIANGTNYSYKKEEGKYYKVDNVSGKETPITKATYDFGVKNFEKNKKAEIEVTKLEVEEKNKSATESTEKDIILAKESQTKEQQNGNKKIIPKRLSQEEERGRSTGGKELIEATNVAERVHRASEKDTSYGREIKIKKQEAAEITKSAKENGTWVDNPKSVFGETPHAKGTEQSVFFYDNGDSVSKINGGNHHDTWLEFFDRIALHNSLFPETKYIVKGFTNYDGKFSVILEQPRIRAERAATKNEIKLDLEKRGFTQSFITGLLSGGGFFENKQTGVNVKDLTGNNAIVDKDGNIFYIDPIVEINTPEKGGKRIVKLTDLSESDNQTETDQQVNTSETFTKLAELYYDVKDADGAAKKREIANERKQLAESMPSIKHIDTNIKEILNQLEQKGLIIKKGDCP